MNIFKGYQCIALVTIIFSGLFSIGASLSIVSESSPASAYDQYKKECLKQVNKKGLSVSDGQKLCNCAIAKFRTTYNINQFKTLLERSKSDKKVQASLNSVGEACFDEILFES